ncbi:XK-related protein 9 [Trichomycterus rosablanca]|uniref:XK-related protein 9 n=1 Tax=Trichomycterus rosablanca TaxID=2290929 RepID=UPI002F35A690
MDRGDGEFTKFRWICTVIGMIFSVVDIGSDLLLSAQYCWKGYYAWFGLTVSFILVGSLCAQIFSYSWFRDDLREEELRREDDVRREEQASTPCQALLHLLQLGFYERYCDLLKRSFKSVWRSHPGEADHRELFGMAADLSMLRLIETFLESVPQLLLQTYIILQHHHTSKIQYLSMAVSFLNVAWSVVDYWRCLRRSLPGTNEMPRGFPTLVYLLYKILTISARVLSFTLLIMLSTFSILAMAFIWLVGTVWAYVVGTDFCTSRCLEQLYRCIIGVILVFTFFNVEGKNSRKAMSLYYTLSTLENLAAPVLMWLFDPRSEQVDFFLPVTVFILMANVMGLLFLVLYYSALHPMHRQADELDGRRQIMNANNVSPGRIERFLMFRRG